MARQDEFEQVQGVYGRDGCNDHSCTQLGQKFKIIIVELPR